MANYGPPGGPYPGRQPDDQYGQPADPWSGQDQWGGQGQWGGNPASTPPGTPESTTGYGDGYPHSGQQASYTSTQHYEAGLQQAPPPGPVWSPTSAVPPQKKGNTGLITLLVVLAVLVLSGGGTAFYLLTKEETKTDPKQATSPAPSTPDASTEPSPEDDPPSSPPVSATDAQLVEVGQCVVNQNPSGEPKLAIAECGPETYEVLARIDGRTNGEEDAKAKCADVEGYTHWYFHDSALDSLDFVLCMKPS